MAVHRYIAALVLMAALGACAELTADAPLFTPADQVGPPPLTEGIWIAVGEDCAPSYARRRSGRFPADCVPVEINRLPDGAWRAAVRVDLVSNLTAEERAQAEADAVRTFRIVLAPAVERSTTDAYAPLYVGEFVVAKEDGGTSLGYVTIAPIGSMPATTFLTTGSIGCADILRDGPIEGVAPRYDRLSRDESGAEQRELSGCVAATQAAVREAARRSVIEDLGDLSNQRYVYVRPR